MEKQKPVVFSTSIEITRDYVQKYYAVVRNNRGFSITGEPVVNWIVAEADVYAFKRMVSIYCEECDIAFEFQQSNGIPSVRSRSFREFEKKVADLFHVSSETWLLDNGIDPEGIIGESFMEWATETLQAFRYNVDEHPVDGFLTVTVECPEAGHLSIRLNPSFQITAAHFYEVENSVYPGFEVTTEEPVWKLARWMARRVSQDIKSGKAELR